MTAPLLKKEGQETILSLILGDEGLSVRTPVDTVNEAILDRLYVKKTVHCTVFLRWERTDSEQESSIAPRRRIDMRR